MIAHSTSVNTGGLCQTKGRIYVTAARNPGSGKCQEYGKRVVNERLSALVEDVVKDYVQMCDDSYMERITASTDWDKRWMRLLAWRGSAMMKISFPIGWWICTL